MYANGSVRVSNIVVTPFPCSLSNNPLNLFRLTSRAFLLRLRFSLRSGVFIMASGREGAEPTGGGRCGESVRRVKRGGGGGGGMDESIGH